jgi:hypothetical protein
MAPKMKYLNYTLALVLSLALFASCGNNKKQNQSTETYDLTDYIKTAETIEPNISNVEQIFDILGLVNAEYYDVLTNDPYSAHNYKTSYPVAAANLGIYMVDILYHFYGEETETMYLSFQAAQELAKHIGVDSEFGLWTLEKLEGSTMQRDTITMMFNTLLEDSHQYHSAQEMVFIHTAFLTGSFVEKVHITGNLLKQKLMIEELSQEDEGDIRELLIIFMNQLNPSTGVLYDAFVQQQDQLEGLVVLSTFEKLKDLSDHLIELKPTLAVAPISKIALNEDLKTALQLIDDLRSVIVTAQ